MHGARPELDTLLLATFVDVFGLFGNKELVHNCCPFGAILHNAKPIPKFTTISVIFGVIFNRFPGAIGLFPHHHLAFSTALPFLPNLRNQHHIEKDCT